MSLGIAFKNTKYLKKGIPTRVDDIQKEINAERIKNSVKAYKKYVPQSDNVIKTYKLGDILGEKLSKII